MKNILLIFFAVILALCANILATLWAKQDNKFSLLFGLLIIISPLVFITFGLVTSKIGLAVTSGSVDALLTISTIAVGLFVFKERNNISGLQYLGILLALIGIALMLFTSNSNK